MTRRITPFVMFEGQAEAAMRFYVSLFSDSEVIAVTRYAAGESGPEGSIKLAEFRIAGQRVLCIDSPVQHAFGFTPAFSLFVDCTDEADLDAAFAQLSGQGAVLMPPASYGFSRKFAWLNDRYGVSWQLNLP